MFWTGHILKSGNPPPKVTDIKKYFTICTLSIVQVIQGLLESFISTDEPIVLKFSTHSSIDFFKSGIASFRRNMKWSRNALSVAFIDLQVIENVSAANVWFVWPKLGS